MLAPHEGDRARALGELSFPYNNVGVNINMASSAGRWVAPDL